jgi:hypothetical protein
MHSHALSRQRLARLEVLIQRLDKRLAGLIAAAPDRRDKAAVRTSVKGLGPVLAAILLALLPELGSASRRTIAELVGVGPYDFDSGSFNPLRRVEASRARRLLSDRHDRVLPPLLIEIKAGPAVRALHREIRDVADRDGDAWRHDRARGDAAVVPGPACGDGAATVADGRVSALPRGGHGGHGAAA